MLDVFDIQQPHTDMVVTGTSVVDTSEWQTPISPLGWEDLAADGVQDRFAELLAPTSRVPIDAEVAETATSLAQGLSPIDACLAATEWVRSRLRYQAGTTDASTSALEALRRGSGVCQDFVHLSLAVLRAMGIPARYTSGYLHPLPTWPWVTGSKDKATPGWRPGLVIGSPLIQPTGEKWANAMSSLAGPGTTPMSHH